MSNIGPFAGSRQRGGRRSSRVTTAPSSQDSLFPEVGRVAPPIARPVAAFGPSAILRLPPSPCVHRADAAGSGAALGGLKAG